MLPEGDYDLVVDDAGEKESIKGNPMIELQLAIEHNGIRVRVIDHLVFTRNAFWKIDAFRVCTSEKLVKGQRVNFEAEDCIGRKGRCHLCVDTYEGKTRNKVSAYLPPPSEGSKPGLVKSGSGEDPDDDLDF